MIKLEKQCVICEERFTPEDVGLDPSSRKDLAIFRHRTICAKARCATLRKKRDHINSAAYRERKFSGKKCDICGKIVFPYDLDLDMRETKDRAVWAATKRCTSKACHEEAARILKERHRPGPPPLNEELENELLLAETISMRNAVFGPMTDTVDPRIARYRKMMGRVG